MQRWHGLYIQSSLKEWINYISQCFN